MPPSSTSPYPPQFLSNLPSASRPLAKKLSSKTLLLLVVPSSGIDLQSTKFYPSENRFSDTTDYHAILGNDGMKLLKEKADMCMGKTLEMFPN